MRTRDLLIGAASRMQRGDGYQSSLASTRDRLTEVLVIWLERPRHERGSVRFLLREEGRDPVRRPSELGYGDHRAPVSDKLESGFRCGRPPALGQIR